MSKLIAIWKILWAHQYAVFTFKEAAPDPTWLTVPTFPGWYRKTGGIIISSGLSASD